MYAWDPSFLEQLGEESEPAEADRDVDSAEENGARLCTLSEEVRVQTGRRKKKKEA